MTLSAPHREWATFELEIALLALVEARGPHESLGIACLSLDVLVKLVTRLVVFLFYKRF